MTSRIIIRVFYIFLSHVNRISYSRSQIYCFQLYIFVDNLQHKQITLNVRFPEAQITRKKQNELMQLSNDS